MECNWKTKMVTMQKVMGELNCLPIGKLAPHWIENMPIITEEDAEMMPIEFKQVYNEWAEICKKSLETSKLVSTPFANQTTLVPFNTNVCTQIVPVPVVVPVLSQHDIDNVNAGIGCFCFIIIIIFIIGCCNIFSFITNV